MAGVGDGGAMITTTRRRLPGVPEVLSLLALAGIAWRLWPEPTPPEGLRCGDVGAPMDCYVRIPGATFRRGAQAADPHAPGYDEAAQPNEGPVVEATVGSFWLQRTEAMVGTWRRCVRAGKCAAGDVAEEVGGTPYPLDAPDDALRDPLPIQRISWKGASDLCAFLGGRLPTEAEWELAARGPEGRRWPWGGLKRCTVPDGDLGFPRLDGGDVASCAQARPLRADALPEPTPQDVIGLGGNVWEWTADAYAPTLDATPPDGPAAPRAQRGGSYLAASPLELRATVRGGVDPAMQLDDVGVRCAFGGGR
jgi:formylglycine-generating enzyme required for sulfatase activity